MQSHLLPPGDWAACEDPTCDLPFHLDHTTPEAAAAIPAELLWPIYEIAQPPTSTLPNGTKIWTDSQAHMHRDYDLPAVVDPDGAYEWYQHGRKHRDGDQPASIQPSGEQTWYQHGQKHRANDQPALTNPHGLWEWWLHGERHRDNDKPAVIIAKGIRRWYQHGEAYRDEDKPAYEDDEGTRIWYINGQEGRIGAPAIIHGSGLQEWRTDGNLDRPGHAPEVITASGVKRWYHRGRSHRFPLLPAVLHPNGSREYWWRGRLLWATHRQPIPQNGWYIDDYKANRLP